MNCVVARVIDTETGMSRKNITSENTTFQPQKKTETNTPIRHYARTPTHPYEYRHVHPHGHYRTHAHASTRARTGAPTPAHARTHATHPRAPTSGAWFSFLCCAGFRYLRLVRCSSEYFIFFLYCSFFPKNSKTKVPAGISEWLTFETV